MTESELKKAADLQTSIQKYQVRIRKIDNLLVTSENQVIISSLYGDYKLYMPIDKIKDLLQSELDHAQKMLDIAKKEFADFKTK